MIDSAKQDRESLAGTHPAGLFLYPDKELKHMLFTSEQVSAGHPDKICDQISDAIVTDCLKHDRNSRVAVETMIKDDHVYVAGEITSKHEPNISCLVRNVLLFTEPELYESFKLETQISKQSCDIALGVDKKGAGDQGMMFGYATNETRKMLPMPFVLATEAIEGLDIKRHPGLLHDAKAQVTYDYRKHRIDTFLMSVQHKEDVEPEDVFHLCKRIMENVAEGRSLNKDFRVLVNPTGRFVTGGSFADTGVTGRKIMCDTYGGACRHGGGAFSGKDPTKVDRSGAYMARKIAKDILRHGFARRCEVQLAYAIGVEEPISICVNTFHTGRVPAVYLVNWIRKHYDLTPTGIISSLGLRDVNYERTATLGHFWHQYMPWEE